MKAYIQAEVDTEAIFDAIAEDGGFALAILRETVDRLNKGALLDDSMDLVQATFSLEEKQVFAGVLGLMKDTVERHIESHEYHTK